MSRHAVLGLSAYYHNSAAALIVDGAIVAAAEEERFTRIKYDSSFPRNAIRYVLSAGGIAPSDLSLIAFYEKPLLKFERVLETYHTFSPRGAESFARAMPGSLKNKLVTRRHIHKKLEEVGAGPCRNVPVLFTEHHLAHAASAFYPSPFEEAAILVVDGVGEWTTISIGAGSGNKITMLKEQHFPHSLGLFYSACTAFCGFRPDADEGTLMGLAAYGTSSPDRAGHLEDLMRENLIDIKSDGSVALNMDYFDFATGFTMYNATKWESLFSLPARTHDRELTDEYTAFACAAQSVLESALMRLARTAREITGMSDLVVAGGVALNCSANGRLLHEGIFENIWIQPAAGDAGGALGAALAAEYIRPGSERVATPDDSMRGSFLGPSYEEAEVVAMAQKFHAPYVRYARFDTLCGDVARHIANGKVVGWFQDRIEWGPRALGARSILADPRDENMRHKLNSLIKHREDLRPFAPAVLAEDAHRYFGSARPSPYMLFTFPVITTDIPAVTHADRSARVQTVEVGANPKFHALLEAFKRETGCGVLLNTSFNGPDEPIVCSPDDAYRCFRTAGIDYLVAGNILFDRANQPSL